MARSPYRVNYDLIAHLYDEPGRDYSVDPYLGQYLEERKIGPRIPFTLIDIGCGTGKQLAANKEQYPDLPSVGLDRFHGMLKQAQKRCRVVDWVQADCIHPPFADDAFDYLTSQFSYHHVEDKQEMIEQAYRLLRPGGRIVITNLDPWTMGEWIVYQFFPASRKRDFHDFLPVDELRALLEMTGFHNIQVERKTRKTYEELETFLEYAGQRHRTSQLMAILDSEYEAGTAKLKKAVENSPAGSKILSPLSLVWIRGDKPEVPISRR